MKADELKNKGQEPIKEQREKKPRAKVEKVLLGKMIGHEKVKVYDKKSEFYGSTFYKIKTHEIENMDKDAPALIYAFKEVIINPEEAKTEKEIKRKEEIWQLIERSHYLGRKYIIYCY